MALHQSGKLMDKFTLLVRLQKPDMALARRMLGSVLNQSNNDWELVLVVSSEADSVKAGMLAEGYPNIRMELRPEGELLAWSCNALLSTLGTWVGFLGQHDQLTPGALDEMAATIAAHPQAHVVYSDEESLGTWGQVSLPFAKGAPDPIRLLSQEYLRDLALIQKSWLMEVNGFDPLASDNPTHDLYLRLMARVGVSGFVHTPQRLYRRHRNRLAPRNDVRDSPYLPGYDLDGVRRHLEREEIPATVRQINGTLDTDYRLPNAPAVTILLVLGDDLVEGKARLAGIGLVPVYQPSTVSVLFHGEQECVFDRYAELCAGLRYPLKRIIGNLPAGLNQEVSGADTDLTLFLQGRPLNAYWLRRLVDLTQLPGVVAAGPNLVTPTRQIEGRPWDSRGNFNQLAVPHSVSILSSACMLVDSRKFLELGGFAPEYPTLHGADFSLRLTGAAGGCARTPRVQVQVGRQASPEPAELTDFRTAWAGWVDPYELHQLP